MIVKVNLPYQQVSPATPAARSVGVWWYLETQWFLSHLQIKSSQLRIHAGGEHIFHFEYLYSCRKTSHQCQQGNLTLELQVAS